MGWLRRAAGVIFAIGVAIGAGLVFLLVAALVDPVTRSSGFTLVQFATAAVVDADGTESLGYSGLTELSGFIWMAVMTVCVAPLVALLPRCARFRGILVPLAQRRLRRPGSFAPHCACRERRNLVPWSCASL
jgi:hypothetical protein